MQDHFSRGLDNRDATTSVFLSQSMAVSAFIYPSGSVAAACLWMKVFLLRCREFTHLEVFHCLKFEWRKEEENKMEMVCRPPEMENVCI